MDTDFAETFRRRPAPLLRGQFVPGRRAWVALAVVGAVALGAPSGARWVAGVADRPGAPAERTVAAGDTDVPAAAPVVAASGEPSAAASQPATGGGTQPATGGGAPPPAAAGGAQPPAAGGGAQPPAADGGAQPPAAGGGTQPPAGGGAQPPATGGGQPPAAPPAVQPATVTTTGAQAAAPKTTAPTTAAAPDGKQIVGHASGRCLTASAAADGSRLILKDCARLSTQLWTFRSDGTIRVAGYCMDAAWGDTANGTALQIARCNGGSAQQFRLNTAHDLTSSWNKCADVVDFSTGNGAPVQLWTCGGTSNQKWSA
ncbi:ricin-type beta-trefoil lectin domain protein [Dactylosporangium sp. CA-092794]|uniref:ricin-type beta-trefoil lectin domain protein n=1 Tax=Dactylosporangium sp. CA-092794 TaxID=3239929 RepID=UPI003D89FBAE